MVKSQKDARNLLQELGQMFNEENSCKKTRLSPEKIKKSLDQSEERPKN